MSVKVLVFDLDGATFDIIKPLMMQGKLPNFKKLISKGVHADLQSTLPPITPCAYASFITGKRPENTGIFDFVFRTPNTHKLQTVNSTTLKGTPFWEIMNAFHKKVGLINLPLTFPATQINGFMVACGLTAPRIEEDNFLYPADLSQRHSINNSNYILKPKWKSMRSRNKKKFYEEVLNMFRARSSLALTLLQKEPWDFFLLHIHAIDWIQHTSWNDETMVNSIYAKVDSLIGKITTLLDNDTIIFVMSDHGFGLTHRTFHLSNWLVASGYLTKKKISFKTLYCKSVEKVYLKTHIKSFLKLQHLYSVLSPQLRNLFDSFLTFLYEKLPSLNTIYTVDYMDRIDWRKTLAYTFGQIGGIYINITENSLMYEKIQSDLTQKLLELKDDRQQNLINNVYTKQQLFKGTHSYKAPDLLLESNKVLYFHPDFDKKGIIRPALPWRIGNHSRKGILISYGKNIAKGKTLETVNIFDLAPTLLYALGCPILKSMDGTVISNAFTLDYQKKNRITYVDDEKILSQRKTPHNHEMKELKAQLRGLGYI